MPSATTLPLVRGSAQGPGARGTCGWQLDEAASSTAKAAVVAMCMHDTKQIRRQAYASRMARNLLTALHEPNRRRKGCVLLDGGGHRFLHPHVLGWSGRAGRRP